MRWHHLRTKPRYWLAALGGVVALAAMPPSAEARGFVGFSFSAPPAYYVPQPPLYYVVPPPPVAAVPIAPPAAAGECREYQAPATIGGQQQQTHGTVCRQPDGSWRIVQ
jgi:hypothetical protein